MSISDGRATTQNPHAVPEQDEQALVRGILRLYRAETDPSALRAAIEALRALRQGSGGGTSAP